MTAIKCSYCQTEAPLYFQSKDYNRKVTNKIFNHYRCPKCELIFIHPTPDDLGKYYVSSYHTIPDSLAAVEKGAKTERFKIEIVQRFCRQGRLLEIGPSHGSFSYLAKQAGFQVEAIEMDPACCLFLNDVVGVHAIQSNDPAQGLLQVGPCDVIALWHVIEHLPNPWKTLEAAFKNLKPGGILVLAAPNPDALQFHIMGRFWPHVDAPRHVMLFPMKVLEEKMVRLGMQVELVTTTDRGGFGWNIFGWEFFFGNLSSQYFISRALRFVGQLVGLFLIPLERREGKGSAYTMVFRKVS